MTRISIIIPVYNEGEYISKLLNHISCKRSGQVEMEVIVVDYNHSTPLNNPEIIYINSPLKGRSEQMNFGAANAKGEILYFLHADSYPPQNFDQLIALEIDNNKDFGCFKMQFDNEHFFLKFFAWFTRFKSNWCRGGDQSLFVRKEIFDRINGFDTSLILMEDLEIIKRLKKSAEFTVITKEPIITSSRKYEANGVCKLQLLFGFIHLQYRMGFSQRSMMRFYNRFITTH